MALTAIRFGLAIGVALGTLGGGVFVLAVPVLVYVLGQSVHEATRAPASLVASNIAHSLASGWPRGLF